MVELGQGVGDRRTDDGGRRRTAETGKRRTEELDKRTETGGRRLVAAAAQMPALATPAAEVKVPATVPAASVAATVTGAGGENSACVLPGDGAIGAQRVRGERGGLRIRRARARKAAQAIGAATAAPDDRTQVLGTSGRGRRGRENGRRKKAGTPAMRKKRANQHHKRVKGKGKGKGWGKGKGKGKQQW